MRGRKGSKRPALVSDEVELPSSIDIINAYSGGAAATRPRLIRAPDGANPTPAVLAVVFLLFGAWLLMTAWAVPRLDLDRVVADGGTGRMASPASDGSPALVVPPGPERSVVVLVLDGPSASTTAVPDIVQDVRDGPGADCDWLPPLIVSRLTVRSETCLRVADGDTTPSGGFDPSVRPVERPGLVREAAAADGVVVIEESDVELLYESSYFVQAGVVLALALLCAAWSAVLVRRDRRMMRRYRAYVDGLLEVPLPGIGR